MIRYKKLGYVELTVTDLDHAVAFYRDRVGLEPAGRGPEGECRFRCSEDLYAVALDRADRGLQARRLDAGGHKWIGDNGVPYEDSPAPSSRRAAA